MVGTPRRGAVAGAVALGLGLGLAGCVSAASGTGGSATASASGTGAPLRLSGPDTDISVVIPAGWHQVIDSAQPSIPEMVAPVSCAGSDEVSCALGLARLASLSASSAKAAALAVQQAVDSGSGVSAGATISAGPSQVAGQAGYLLRFRFSNSSGTLTSSVAAVPSGAISASPGASGTGSPGGGGNGQFAVVLVWVSGKTGAPTTAVISQIIGSAALTSGST